MGLGLDKSGWKRVRLGQVIRRSRKQIDPFEGGSDRYVAGGHIDGESMTIGRWGDVNDGQMGSTFRYVFTPGQILFVSARPYLRKTGVANFSGVVADKTYVLDAAPENGLLQVFLPFVLSSEPFVEYATIEATGSMNPRLLWGPLQRYEFDLPPLDEQKRIAQLLWSLESHRAAVAATKSHLSGCLQLLMSKRLTTFSAKRRIGDLAATRSGPSFSASSVHEEPVADSSPVLGITNTRSDGTIDLSKVAYVTGLPDSTGKIDETSLILIRTNGNRKRIGNVYLPPPAAYGHAVSAFQFLMKVGDSSIRDYLHWVLRTDGMQSRMSDAASGTTGLGNLAVKWLSEQEIPWSVSASEREAFVKAADSFLHAERCVLDELAALLTLRRELNAAIFGDRS